MIQFTPASSFLGGILIGLAATILLATIGRIAGVSGIVGGLMTGDRRDAAWRLAFCAGLVGGGVVAAAFAPQKFAVAIDRSWPAMAVAGLLVGYGSRLGSGCTSGHGVCGIARGSKRSIAATATFMTTGALTILLVGRLFGGRI